MSASRRDVPAGGDQLRQRIAEILNELTGVRGEEGERAVRLSELQAAGLIERAPDGSIKTGREVESLRATVLGIDGTVQGLTRGVSGLESTVESLNGTLTLSTRRFDALQTKLDLSTQEGENALKRLSAESTAVRDLVSRIESTERGISVIAQHAVKLQSSLQVGEGTLTFLNNEVTANASAYQSLDSRVEATENEIVAHAQFLTQLDADVTAAKGDITDIQDVNSAQGQLIQSLDTRVTANEDEISSQSTLITDMQNRLQNAEGTVVANSSAISTLDSRVGATPNGFSSFATKIDSLDTSIAGKASASALDTLDARVGATPNGFSSFAAKITSLDSSIAGKAEAGAVTALTARTTTLEQNGEGVNQLANSTFKVDLSGWTLDASLTTGTMTRNLHGMGYQPPLTDAAVLTFPSNASLSAWVGIKSTAIPVTPGATYSGSAYMAQHRATGGVQIWFYDAAGAVIQQPGDAGPVSYIDSGGLTLNSYTRRGVIAVAPAGAVTARLLVFGRPTGETTYVDSYLWIVKPMLAQVKAGQTVLPAWNAGGDEVRPTVSANAAAITSINAALPNKAETSAVNALDTRVTQTEQGIAANASSITTVNAKINPHNNMLLNPSFVGGFGSWTLYNGPQNYVDVTSGSIALMPASAGIYRVVQQRVTVAPNVQYTAAADAWRNTAAGSIYIETVYRDASDNIVLHLTGSHTGTGGKWDRIVVSGTAPATAAYVDVSMVTFGTDAEAYFRRPKLERGTIATVFTDERTVSGNVTATQALEVRANNIEAVGAGHNLLRNSLFGIDLKGWLLADAMAPTVMTRNMHGFAWQPEGMNAIVLAPNNSVGAVDNAYAYAYQKVPATPGQRYMASAYLAAHRINVFAYVYFEDMYGNYLGGAITPNTTPGAAGTSLSSYTRLHVADVAPSGAHRVIAGFGARKMGTGATYDAPYVWIIRPMLEAVKPTQTLPSPYNAGGAEFSASYTLQLDVNGYVSGFASYNDGITSEFSVLANKFKVVNPGGGAGLTWENGTLWSRGSSHSVIIGQSFGASGDLMFWAGANPGSVAAASKGNAKIWFDNSGGAYFGGAIAAGALTNSIQTTLIGLPVGVTLGPFGTNGGTKTVLTSYLADYGLTVSGNQTTTYNGKTATVRVHRYRTVAGSSEVYLGFFDVSQTSVATYDAELGVTNVSCFLSGSHTFGDTTGGTANFSYRAYAEWNSGTVTWGQRTQKLSINSSEG